LECVHPPVSRWSLVPHEPFAFHGLRRAGNTAGSGPKGGIVVTHPVNQRLAPFTRDLKVDAASQRRLLAMKGRVVLEVRKEHDFRALDATSEAEFRVHWGTQKSVVNVAEAAASFGIMVSARPATPEAYATLLLFALEYGEPSAWFVDESLVDAASPVLPNKDVTAAWVLNGRSDTVQMLVQRATFSYAWRRVNTDLIVARAAPALGLPSNAK